MREFKPGVKADAVPPLVKDSVPADSVPFEAETAPDSDPMTAVPVMLKLPPTVEEAVEMKPPLKKPVEEIDRSVVEAYGRVLTAVVVAKMLPTVNWVPVAMSAVPPAFDAMMEFGEKPEALVPPLANGRMPETCEVRETVPVKLECDRQEPAMAKQPPEMFHPTVFFLMIRPPPRM